MLSLIKNFPQHLQDALRICQTMTLQNRVDKAWQQVVIVGVGGSAIAGRLMQQWLQKKMYCPIIVHQNYYLPRYIHQNTLLIVNSYSGNTSETIACLQEGIQAKAHIICITSGGKIKALAKKNDIDCIEIPSHMPPRTCLGYTLIFQMYIFTEYRFIENHDQEVNQFLEYIKQYPLVIAQKAQAMAQKYQDKKIILYTAIDEEATAIRWRQQLNENSKRLCWHHVYPEICHNEIVGWKNEQNYAVLFLRTSYEHDVVSKSIKITQQMIQPYAEVMDVFAQGNTPIAQTLYLIHLGDWFSYALAMLDNIDPMPIAPVEEMKKALQKNN